MPVPSPTPVAAGRRTDRARLWTVVSVLAVAVHLYGLYRVTGPPSPPWFPSADKLQHLVGFGLPALLVLVTVEAYAQRGGRHASGTAVAVVGGAFALHAVVSEVIQHLAYATRSGDPLDAAFDLAGVALGLVAFTVLRRGRARGRR